MWCYTSLFIRYIFSIIGDFICYLLTAAVILTTKSLLLLIFINIIPIQMFLLIPLRLSLSAFVILIYPILINLWLINIPNSSLLYELLPVCSVLIKQLSNIYGILCNHCWDQHWYKAVQNCGGYLLMGRPVPWHIMKVPGNRKAHLSQKAILT